MHYLVANINDFTDAQIDLALKQMPQKQREYIENKKQLRSKKQSIVARILLKNLLLKFFEISDGSNIEFDENGKPNYSNSTDIHISLTHSGDFAAAAVSNKPVGIDIQVYKQVSEKLLNRVCTKDELEFVNSTGNKGFFKIWTAKEAYSKCSCINLTKVFKLSFVKNDTLCGLDKKLYSYSDNSYELAIIE